jgi:purine nucleoside permease
LAASCAAVALTAGLLSGYSFRSDASPRRRPIKVFVITMVEPSGPKGGESRDWLDRLGLNERMRIPGLNPAFPRVACHRDDVCLVTTGGGQANAATSLMSILASRRFDLRRTYFLVAGIAGIDPADGTLGSAAWARWAVSGDLADEIDAREIPPDWPTGYFGLGAAPPGVSPTDRVGTEVYHLNESLVQRAYALTRNITLTDSADAQAYRAQYPPGPAAEPPAVTMCDTVTDDTYWEGKLLSDRVNAWTALMTDGRGNYCTTQQEDNATLTALRRGADAHWIDFGRVAVLRTASDFDQPYPGQTPYAALSETKPGFALAIENTFRVGSTYAHHIVTHWRDWKHGVPSTRS